MSASGKKSKEISHESIQPGGSADSAWLQAQPTAPPPSAPQLPQAIFDSATGIGDGGVGDGGGSGSPSEPWRQLQQAAFAYNLDPHLLAVYNSGIGLDGPRRKNATRETTALLKAWLQEHKRNPYPSKGEKIMLAIITKMTLTQVSTWFANARRRLKKENKMTWSPRNRSEEEKRQAEEAAGAAAAAERDPLLDGDLDDDNDDDLNDLNDHDDEVENDDDANIDTSAEDGSDIGDVAERDNGEIPGLGTAAAKRRHGQAAAAGAAGRSEAAAKKPRIWSLVDTISDKQQQQQQQRKQSTPLHLPLSSMQHLPQQMQNHLQQQQQQQQQQHLGLFPFPLPHPLAGLFSQQSAAAVAAAAAAAATAAKVSLPSHHQLMPPPPPLPSLPTSLQASPPYHLPMFAGLPPPPQPPLGMFPPFAPPFPPSLMPPTSSAVGTFPPSLLTAEFAAAAAAAAAAQMHRAG